VKSHGGTDAQGFAHAVDVAMDMVTHRFNDRIRDGVSQMQGLNGTSSETTGGGGDPRLATAE
jgi:glycerol-3-phosphate acyltransferase PlsX